MKRSEGKWVETYRLKQQITGYYDTLRSYLIAEGDKTYAIAQSCEKHTKQVYKIDVETAKINNITSEFKHTDFAIQNVEQTGLITGILSSFNFNTFFYIHHTLIHLVDPP